MDNSSSSHQYPLKSCLKKSDASPRQRRSKLLCFGEVSFQEYPMILGDNPYCQGAPLQLDWTPQSFIEVDIDFYEFTRDKRRTKKQLHLGTVDREIYLLSLGYSMNELIAAGDRGLVVRKQRAASFQNKKWDRFNVVLESAKSALQSNHKIVSAKTA